MTGKETLLRMTGKETFLRKTGKETFLRMTGKETLLRMTENDRKGDIPPSFPAEDKVSSAYIKNSESCLILISF